MRATDPVPKGAIGQVIRTHTTGELTEVQELAAWLVASDRLSDHEIAATVGRHRATLARWKHRPAFRARVQAHVTAYASYLERVMIENARWESQRFAGRSRDR